MSTPIRITRIPGPSGRTLDATLVVSPGSSLGAVLLHMYGGRRQDWGELQLRMRDAGISSISIDYRGNLGSGNGEDQLLYDGRYTPHFLSLQRDAAAAKAYLLANTTVDPRAVAMLGASIGTTTALRAAVRDPEVPVIVLMSPGLDYLGMNARPEMKAYSRPVLMTFAEREWGEPVAVDTLRRLHPDPRKVKLRGFDDHFEKAHGTHQFDLDPGFMDEVIAYIKPYLERAIL